MNDDEILRQLYIDVEMLKRENIALRNIVKVLTAKICEDSPESAKRTQTLLAALVLYGNHVEKPPFGDSVRLFIEEAHLLTAEGVDPLKLLLLLAQMGKEAGPDRLDALKIWLSQATVDEIVQDAQPLIEQWMPRNAGPSDEPQKGAD